MSFYISLSVIYNKLVLAHKFRKKIFRSTAKPNNEPNIMLNFRSSCKATKPNNEPKKMQKTHVKFTTKFNLIHRL